MVLRAYRFRCYPNATQQQQLAQIFGANRWVWNRCLAWRSHEYEQDKASITGVDFSRELTFIKTLEPYQWLRDVPATTLSQTLRDQDGAFRRFFKDKAVGYPRYKKRHDKQSVRFQLDQRVVMNNYRAGQLLKLPRMGAIKVNWSRVPAGVPKMVTISLDRTGRYWVSMGIEETITALPDTDRSIGVDLGLLSLATFSDGTVIDNPRHLASRREQIKKLQQRLSRQVKGSGRWRETKRRLAKCHWRITNGRREALHRLTTQLINDNQVICVEDLNVKCMSASSKGSIENPGSRVKQKAGLNRSILDGSFGEFTRQLEYKAQWYGRTLIKVDTFYPSSKTCSSCGHKLDELRLDLRQWQCPTCQVTHDRDINAAMNIRNEGLNQLSPAGM